MAGTLGLAGCATSGPGEGAAPGAPAVASPVRTTLVALSADRRLLQFEADHPSALTRVQRLEGQVGAATVAAAGRGDGLLLMHADGRLVQVAPGAKAALTGAQLPVSQRGSAGRQDCQAAIAWQPVQREWRVLVAGAHGRLDTAAARLIDGDASQPGLQADAPLRYAPGDPHYGKTPWLAALAHAVPGRAGALTPATPVTTYGLDAATASLVRLGSRPGAGPVEAPQAGRLHTVGPLGVTGWTCARLAIVPAGDGTPLAYAALQGSRTELYRIDLERGAATRIGTIGDGGTPLIGLWPLGQAADAR